MQAGKITGAKITAITSSVNTVVNLLRATIAFGSNFDTFKTTGRNSSNSAKIAVDSANKM